MSDAQWERVSEEGRDLVLQLLNKDPSLRPSAQVALRHPWVTATSDAARPPSVNAGPRSRQRQYQRRGAPPAVAGARARGGEAAGVSASALGLLMGAGAGGVMY